LFGIVLWNFFVEVTVGSIGGIVGKGDLIRKINFPKHILIFSSSLSALINVSINLFVVFLFILFDGVHITTSALLAIPILIEFFIFSVGIAFFLSAAYVRFRDIGYIWEVLIQGAVYATPIIYPLDDPIKLRYQKVLILNPLAQMIQDARHAVITNKARSIEAIYGSSWFRLIPIGVVIFIFVSSALYFRKRSKSFAEHV
jgi:ABC-2 type transport system permease protein